MGNSDIGKLSVVICAYTTDRWADLIRSVDAAEPVERYRIQDRDPAEPQHRREFRVDPASNRRPNPLRISRFGRRRRRGTGGHESEPEPVAVAEYGRGRGRDTGDLCGGTFEQREIDSDAVDLDDLAGAVIDDEKSRPRFAVPAVAGDQHAPAGMPRTGDERRRSTRAFLGEVLWHNASHDVHVAGDAGRQGS